MDKPQLSFWQIWNMCFGFFGIQVGFALQNANVSRIFQTLGADVHDLPILWVAAPLTGLLVQPIIGYMSDRTWTSMGRRRPYFFYGAILTTGALLIMPNSPSLWIAAGMLWVMDASINVTMEPFRAFVGDMLPEKQHNTGFAMQSFFIGLGSVLASALPYMLANWFGVSNEAPDGEVPLSVKLAFYAGAVMLFLAVMWTVRSTNEYSPEEMKAFEEAEEKRKAELENVAELETVREAPTPNKFIVNGGIWLMFGGVATVIIGQYALAKELYILSVLGVAFGIMLVIAGLLKQRGREDNPFSEIIDDLFLMPTTMRQLALVQFFSWFALFGMWIYTTSGVTAFHFGALTPEADGYNDGADWVGVLFAMYNGFAALAAFAIPMMAARTNRRIAHIICLIMGGLGLVSFIFIKDPTMLLVSMIGVGFAWASILSVPYAILSGSVPAGKLGIYMGIFNFFIVIPQLTAASVLGPIIKNAFDGEAIYGLVLGGISMFIAALFTLRVSDIMEKKAEAYDANEQQAATE